MKRAYVSCRVAALLLSLGLGAGAADAAEVKVETKAHRFFADVGEAGPDFSASAMISVLVTRGDGAPVSSLGASITLGTSAITLPPAWRLETSFVGPPGLVGIACILSPTDFTNRGNGLYTIRVAPFLGDPICRWGLGDYHYVVRIQTPLLRGSALGVLTIPDSPSVP